MEQRITTGVLRCKMQETMKFDTQQLLSELKQITRENLERAKAIQAHSEEALAWREDEKKWNALECIQHLNWYSDFYLPEIDRRIQAAPKKSHPEFKTNWLGKKFVKAVSPLEQGAKGMNTMKDKNPLAMDLSPATLDQFIGDQERMLKLLDAAKEVNLTKTKTSISISKLIKVRLGDTFRVVIYHNQRHLQQAERALQGFNRAHGTTEPDYQPSGLTNR